MLPLQSERWSDLTHAYGDASNIPKLLIELESLPSEVGYETEPYFSLWSALCHQGKIYTASFAAVPHIVRIMRNFPDRIPWTLFSLVASIEIARCSSTTPSIPPDLQADYARALAYIPELVAEAARLKWDHWYCLSALSAAAASKGFCEIAEAIQELDTETIQNLFRRKFGKD
jgi:hypothetical protein